MGVLLNLSQLRSSQQYKLSHAAHFCITFTAVELTGLQSKMFYFGNWYIRACNGLNASLRPGFNGLLDLSVLRVWVPFWDVITRFRIGHYRGNSSFSQVCIVFCVAPEINDTLMQLHSCHTSFFYPIPKRLNYWFLVNSILMSFVY